MTHGNEGRRPVTVLKRYRGKLMLLTGSAKNHNKIQKNAVPTSRIQLPTTKCVALEQTVCRINSFRLLGMYAYVNLVFLNSYNEQFAYE